MFRCRAVVVKKRFLKLISRVHLSLNKSRTPRRENSIRAALAQHNTQESYWRKLGAQESPIGVDVLPIAPRTLTTGCFYAGFPESY